jgi:hypothetical protein
MFHGCLSPPSTTIHTFNPPVLDQHILTRLSGQDICDTTLKNLQGDGADRDVSRWAENAGLRRRLEMLKEYLPPDMRELVAQALKKLPTSTSASYSRPATVTFTAPTVAAPVNPVLQAQIGLTVKTSLPSSDPTEQPASDEDTDESDAEDLAGRTMHRLFAYYAGDSVDVEREAARRWLPSSQPSGSSQPSEGDYASQDEVLVENRGTEEHEDWDVEQLSAERLVNAGSATLPLTPRSSPWPGLKTTVPIPKISRTSKHDENDSTEALPRTPLSRPSVDTFLVTPRPTRSPRKQANTSSSPINIQTVASSRLPESSRPYTVLSALSDGQHERLGCGLVGLNNTMQRAPALDSVSQLRKRTASSLSPPLVREASKALRYAKRARVCGDHELPMATTSATEIPRASSSTRLPGSSARQLQTAISRKPILPRADSTRSITRSSSKTVRPRAGEKDIVAQLQQAWGASSGHLVESQHIPKEAVTTSKGTEEIGCSTAAKEANGQDGVNWERSRQIQDQVAARLRVGERITIPGLSCLESQSPTSSRS